MNKNINIIHLALLVLMFIAIIPLQAQAIDYYVSTTGSGSTCSVVSPCALSYANTNAAAGDTVYLLAGTYNNDGYINPTNSGRSGNLITYEGYGGTVKITGQAYAVFLGDDNYIKVKGITGDNCTQLLRIQNSKYNQIEGCTFNRNSTNEWNHSLIYKGSQYNWIHDNIFSRGGICSGGSDEGSVLDIGDEYNANDTTAYNLIEDNVFFYGGHHVVGLMSQYNTFRNNYLHNEAWTNGKGNRTLYLNGHNTNAKKNLIEGNRFGYAAPPCDDTNVGGVLISTSNNIIRFNDFYHHDVYGLYFQVYAGYSNANYNHVFNNTFFNNCNSTVWPYLCNGGFEDSAIAFNDWESSQEVKYNIFKNNLYFKHHTPYTDTDQAKISDQIFANEFNADVSGNPLFVNASTTYPSDKNDSTVPDLSILNNSPAKDAGGALTNVSASDTGSGTSLVVADAGYFQDGTWGPPGRIDADWIAVRTVDNTVHISSISGNTITLVNSISRSDGDSVWLYKDSDGRIVIYGSAPDAGAHEFLQDTAPGPPKNFRFIDQTP